MSAEPIDLDALTDAELHTALVRAARDLRLAADRADTLDEEDERRREARQVGLAALLWAQQSAMSGRISVLESDRDAAVSWLKVGSARVAVHAAADMDAVHASRASRREQKREVVEHDPACIYSLGHLSPCYLIEKDEDYLIENVDVYLIENDEATP